MTRLDHTLDVMQSPDSLHTLTAKARWLWWRHVRRYDWEVCHDCGRPVDRGIHSYWAAPDALWQQVIGHAGGVLCPSCFTIRADTHGIHLHWEPRPWHDHD